LSVADIKTRTEHRVQSRYRPVAVVDIGSNSVRLVIFDGPWRHASALHNEKAICAIGRNMVTTGRLDEAGMDVALETLLRFRELCAGHDVRDVGAVATAAARDAENGREFIRRAEKALGKPIRILSGEEEANTAAEGTLAGIPGADGLVADLGGGSLDMVTVKDGATGPGWTRPAARSRGGLTSSTSPRRSKVARSMRWVASGGRLPRSTWKAKPIRSMCCTIM
jgi:exopolyphosphatase/guanosine-5'-triphosphate,3'-diphosphate pyrophosphatase